MEVMIFGKPLKNENIVCHDLVMDVVELVAIGRYFHQYPDSFVHTTIKNVETIHLILKILQCSSKFNMLQRTDDRYA